MLSDGTAAAVKIIGEGKRQLRCSPLPAHGDNLKNNDNKVDTSRPVVLLLTGSSGSAEEQGFDVAKFYTENRRNRPPTMPASAETRRHPTVPTTRQACNKTHSPCCSI